jgi:hypothetical protein
VTSGNFELAGLYFSRDNAFIWDFGIDDNLMLIALGTNGHISDYSVSNGLLTLDIGANDPQLYTSDKLFLDTQKYSKFKIRLLNNTSADDGNLFVSTTDNRGFSGDRRIDFRLTPNSPDYEEITIDLSEYDFWTGDLVELRIDPVGNNSGGTVYIDYFELIADADNDGLQDIAEDSGNNDADDDGIPNSLEVDADNDGAPDALETLYGRNPYANVEQVDTDGDGQEDLFEMIAGNSPDDSNEFLALNIAPTLTNTLTLSTDAKAGRQYIVEASPNLSPDSWSEHTTSSMATVDGVLELLTITLDPEADDEHFYRITPVYVE